MNITRSIKRSQTITPFGVGAIYDLGDESLVAMDISSWKEKTRIRLIRLEKALGAKSFYMAPIPGKHNNNTTATVPYYRFPTWLFCSKCRQMIQWTPNRERVGKVPECPDCTSRQSLVPMRFVVACNKGHLDDVPWKYWAHSKAIDENQKKCQSNTLKFLTLPGKGSGLEALVIKCSTCGAHRSLFGITKKDSLKSIGVKCKTRQPWERDWRMECTETPQVLQRGASNLYYPCVVSALDIPDDSDLSEGTVLKDKIQNNSNFQYLIKLSESSKDEAMTQPLNVLATLVASEVKCTAEAVVKMFNEYQNNSIESEDTNEESLLYEEWKTLSSNVQWPDSESQYLSTQVNLEKFLAELKGENYKHLISLIKLTDKLVLIKKLREVRVLKGFQRIIPETTVPVDLGRKTEWLPAIEVFGEGIFFSIKEEVLKKWETRKATIIEKRIRRLRSRHESANLRILPPVTARFIMLHTLAHILIRQLAYECGYSASSLRERIYCTNPKYSNDEMNGILIYTAATDSEGSLGGLVRQGNPERFFPSLYNAILKSLWCSSDPICREMTGQGLAGLNLAACHACTLISETSCVYMNVMLDRAMVASEMSDDVGFIQIG